MELRLTFDVYTLQKVAAGIDANGDHQLTPAELRAAAPALEEFLREQVRMEIDDEPAVLGECAGPEWPRDGGDALHARDWHSNAALIAIPFKQATTRAPREIAVSFHVFDTFGIRHTVLGAFEHSGRREEVTFTSAEPDYLFDTGYAGPESTAEAAAPARASPLFPALRRFFRLGVEHIFLGYDHVCFLVALLVVSRFGELVKIVTSFTVAHSITLIAAALGAITLPPRLVECGIAASIVYLAGENLVRKAPANRWLLTFAFGLIHGFGFAYVLDELGLPVAGRVRCLLAFNLGVEAGQLAIVAAIFPLALLLSRVAWGDYAKARISIAVGLFGLGWFLDRAFGLGLMPI